MLQSVYCVGCLQTIQIIQQSIYYAGCIQTIHSCPCTCDATHFAMLNLTEASAVHPLPILAKFYVDLTFDVTHFSTSAQSSMTYQAN